MIIALYKLTFTIPYHTIPYHSRFRGYSTETAGAKVRTIGAERRLVFESLRETVEQKTAELNVGRQKEVIVGRAQTFLRSLFSTLFAMGSSDAASGYQYCSNWLTCAARPGGGRVWRRHKRLERRLCGRRQSDRAGVERHHTGHDRQQHAVLGQRWCRVQRWRFRLGRAGRLSVSTRRLHRREYTRLAAPR